MMVSKAVTQVRLAERIATQIKLLGLTPVTLGDIATIVSLVESLTDSVFIVSERRELNGAAWFDPVVAYHTREEALREAEARQQKAMAAFEESGDTDSWRQPFHEVKEVFFGGRSAAR